MHYTCIQLHTWVHAYVHSCVHTYLQTVFASHHESWVSRKQWIDRGCHPVGWCRGLFVNDVHWKQADQGYMVVDMCNMSTSFVARNQQMIQLASLTISQNRMCLQSGIHSPNLWWFQGWVPWSDGRTPRLKSWSLPPRCKKKRYCIAPETSTSSTACSVPNFLIS